MLNIKRWRIYNFEIEGVFRNFVNFSKFRKLSKFRDFYEISCIFRFRDGKLLKESFLKSNNVDQAVNGTSTQKYSSHHVTGEHDEAEEHRPFPTLLEALKNVSHDVGFNIEVWIFLEYF